MNPCHPSCLGRREASERYAADLLPATAQAKSSLSYAEDKIVIADALEFALTRWRSRASLSP
jgi:hypothetical protein